VVIDVTASGPDLSLSTRLDLTVTVANDCTGVTCSGHGMCLDQVGDYTCDCDSGYHGRNCELAVTTTEEPITINIQNQEAATAGGGKSGMSAGAIAALCIVLILVLAVLLGFFMYLRNKREKESSVINDLHVISSAKDVAAIESVSNPMYGAWWQPHATKNQVYQTLAPEAPGSFIIRNAHTATTNPTFVTPITTRVSFLLCYTLLFFLCVAPTPSTQSIDHV
jgi:hypothetical protein